MSKVNYTKVYGRKACAALNLAINNCWTASYCVFNPTLDVQKFHILECHQIDIKDFAKPGLAVTGIDNEVCILSKSLIFQCDIIQEPFSNKQLRQRIKSVIDRLSPYFEADEPLVFFINLNMRWKSLSNKKFFKTVTTLMLDYETYIYDRSHITEEDFLTINDLKNVYRQLLKPTYEGKDNDVFIQQRKKLTYSDFLKFFSDGNSSAYKSFLTIVNILTTESLYELIKDNFSNKSIVKLCDKVMKSKFMNSFYPGKFNSAWRSEIDKMLKLNDTEFIKMREACKEMNANQNIYINPYFLFISKKGYKFIFM